MLSVKMPPSHVQMPLLEVMPNKRLEGTGERRTRFGQVVEEVVERLLPVVALGGGGVHDAVYDAAWGSALLEVKSVKRTSSVPLYVSRLEKDEQVEGQGHEVVYLIAAHGCPTCHSLREVWGHMSRTLRDVYAVPGEVIRQRVEGVKVHQLVRGRPGSRVGYEREGYCRGYQLLKVSEVSSMDYMRVRVLTGSVYGLPFTIRLHRHIALRGRMVFKREKPVASVAGGGEASA